MGEQRSAQLLPLSYSESEIYHFVALDERVPVYQKPFTLVREIILEGDLKAQAAHRGQATLTVTATHGYQACDDKLCYNPVSLPLL